MLHESEEAARNFPLNFGNFMIGVCFSKKSTASCSGVYLGACQLSVMGVFCENS